MVSVRTEAGLKVSLNQVQGAVVAAAMGFGTLGPKYAGAGLTVGLHGMPVFEIRTGAPATSNQLERFIAVAPYLLRPSARVEQALGIEPDELPVR